MLLLQNQVNYCFYSPKNLFDLIIFGHLKLHFETALTNEPSELIRMWKINSSAYQRNIRTVSCCCGRNNCAEPGTRNTKISLVPFLLLNRKLCEHKLRNQTGSSEIWTLPNPRHGGAESAFLVLAAQRNMHGTGGSSSLNARIWTENQHLPHAT